MSLDVLSSPRMVRILAAIQNQTGFDTFAEVGSTVSEIFNEASRQKMGKPWKPESSFEISPQELRIVDFFRQAVSPPASGRVPYPEWADLAAEGLELLRRFILSGAPENFEKDTTYQEHQKKRLARDRQWEQDPRFRDLLHEMGE